MIVTFKLAVDRDPRSPTITVENLSTEGVPPAKLELTPGTEPPYQLAVDRAADSDAKLIVRLNEPFDPQVTRDSNVLHVETSLSDRVFGTQDDTKYILHVTNKSRYYLAEDIHVQAVLTTKDLPRLPDGNASLSLTPSEQHIQCIDPGQTKDLVFVAVARGPKPGMYPVEITIAYRLLYWDGRRARDTSHHVLPVQGANVRLDLPKHSAPARMPRQPSLARSNDMSRERQSPYLAPLSPRARHHHHLKPIVQQFPLPGGGNLEVGYRLIKGHHRNPDRGGCSYGHNPDTNEVESYFSTQDTAALELTLHNESHHSLKHVYLAGIRLMSVNDEKVAGPATDSLPDGNLLFEVVPNEIYFGHLAAHAKETKFLSLITRGVAPGHYAVQFQAHYDIEQCHVPIDLWLTVRPD